MNKLNQNIRLNSRGVLSLSGKDTETFLQGLITNDIAGLQNDHPLYSAILTPQGKYLFDFILHKKDNAIFVDCEKSRADELIKRLTFYRLRAEVIIEDCSHTHQVWALEHGVADPRHALLGARGIVSNEKAVALESADETIYEMHRLMLGVPDGSRDIEIDKRPILEANFIELNGVSFKKGCYVGQEVTARMHYRKAVRKRLYPVEIVGALPEPGTALTADGVKVGTLYSGYKNRAIALIRNETVEGKKTIHCEGQEVIVHPLSY